MERGPLCNLKLPLHLIFIALYLVLILNSHVGRTSGFTPSYIQSTSTRTSTSTSTTATNKHESETLDKEGKHNPSSNVEIFDELSLSSPLVSTSSSSPMKVGRDNRPHEQRVKHQRKARRLNHSFMHLYRHDSPRFDDQKIAPSSKSFTCAKTYLMEYGHLDEDTVMDMAKFFPPLFDLDVKRHLCPKMRFLKYTLGYHNGTNADIYADVDVNAKISTDIGIDDNLYRLGHRSSKATATFVEIIPPQYFGSRLEKVIAPRHAFLMAEGLPHGSVLLKNDAALFKEFLVSCRRLKSFTALCNQWRKKYGRTFADYTYDDISKEVGNVSCAKNDNSTLSPITSTEVDAFDSLFTRGIMAASRGDMDPQNQYMKHYNITSGQMIYLLTKHGANPFETDVRDISLLHWAAGSGELSALKELIRAQQEVHSHFEEAPAEFGIDIVRGVQDAVKIKADRDGATILHWAAAGAKAKEFGCGGHLNICQFLMDNCGGPSREKEIVNTLTKDGNSVLMWAAWSGSLDIVKLMIRHRASPSICNRNGCTVAHWAASAGIVEICDYLHNTINVDFDVQNNAGNTPLSHAVAYGRTEVIKWLKEEVNVLDTAKAGDLALDFVDWEEDNVDRKTQRFGLLTATNKN